MLELQEISSYGKKKLETYYFCSKCDWLSFFHWTIAPVDRVVITGLEPSVNTMVASWKRPQKPSQCDIDSYKLEYTYRNCTTSTPEIMAINTNETSYTVEGLQPYWNYNFTVTAFINNEKGNSPSNTSSARTLGSGELPFIQTTQSTSR